MLRKFILDPSVQLRVWIKVSAFIYKKVPMVGRPTANIIDQIIRVLYGLEVCSFSINVKHLHIGHSVGCILGGNGIKSPGRVLVMAGVIFGAKTFSSPEYLAAHKTSSTFLLGDNVVLCSHVILLGPLSICDNVVVAAGAVVTQSITEPGVYAGSPARRVAEYSDWLECADMVFGSKETEA